MVKKLELYLRCSKDFQIQDHKGNVYSVQQARNLFESGKVTGTNLSFSRLAALNFDLVSCRKEYEQNEQVAIPTK